MQTYKQLQPPPTPYPKQSLDIWKLHKKKENIVKKKKKI
jgi:hypothetical protein